MANDIELSTGSLYLNRILGSSYYVLHNTPEILSTLSTRKTEIPKQGDHGTEDSLSYYGGRILPIEGEIIAPTQADRITLEKALRRALALPVAQDFDGEDGYALWLLTDEDEIDKQFYAKVLEPPKFELVDTAMPEHRRFSFVLYAKDPAIYAQALSEESSLETFNDTTFHLHEGEPPEIKDAALPTIQDAEGVEMIVTNNGTFGSPPVITVAGPCTNPVITNSTTGRSMEFAEGAGVDLAEGDTLTINVGAKTCIKTSGGSDTDVSAALTAVSEWIYIEPGDNAFTLSDDTAGDLTGLLTVSFRDAWI